MRSSISCTNCGNILKNYEPFSELSLGIPKSDKSVEKCLEIYFEKEKIDGDYTCEKCKTKNKVRKYFIININYTFLLMLRYLNNMI